MAAARTFSTINLVNGSTGDPVLYLDYPGSTNAMLFDAGENHRLSNAQLGDLECTFLTHHHVDHFIGFDRIVRANIDQDKTLRVFGPIGTIQKVYDRIHSYEYPFFPFQKIAIEINELDTGTIRTGLLECTKRFPPPTITERAWSGGTCYENEHLRVEAAPADHTVPCWSYALVEKSGYHPDPAKLSAGMLKPGEWVAQVLRQLRSGESLDTEIEIRGGRFTLKTLAEQYFAESQGARVAFITDTLYSEAVRPGLIRLAKGAWRLYCDSFYATSHLKQAQKHKHMTATQAAELAKAAKVEHLELIHFSTRYAGNYQPLIDEAAAIFPRVSATLNIE